jgi:phage shock protein A
LVDRSPLNGHSVTQPDASPCCPTQRRAAFALTVAKFERLKNRVEQAEAEAEALTELRGGASAPLDEPTPTVATEADIAAELAEPKRKLKR